MYLDSDQHLLNAQISSSQLMVAINSFPSELQITLTLTITIKARRTKAIYDQFSHYLRTE
jgi:hypothetical protein